MIPFIPLIAAGIGAAATGVELANQPSAPSTADAGKAAQAASLAQAQALQKRRGMAATTLNSPMSPGTAVIGKATLG